MYIDSHCHLNMLKLDADYPTIQDLIKDLKSYDIDLVLNIATSMDDIPPVIDLAKQFDSVYASCGIHPSEAPGVVYSMDDLMTYASEEKVVAIGETGLDYYYNTDHLEVMRERFIMHIELAKRLKKPLIIHTRKAPEDTIDLMAAHGAEQAGAVMHCFTESWSMAKQALDMGFYISISGIVTFKNADQVVEVVKKMPLDRLLIETDAPYLAPVPHRGKSNLPIYVPLVAKKIAEIKGVDVQEVASASSANFCQLFFNEREKGWLAQ